MQYCCDKHKSPHPQEKICVSADCNQKGVYYYSTGYQGCPFWVCAGCIGVFKGSTRFGEPDPIPPQWDENA